MWCSISWKVGFYQLGKSNLSLYFTKMFVNLWKLQFTKLRLSNKTNLAKSLNAKQNQIMLFIFIQTNLLLVNISYWEERRQENGWGE